jgi:putative ABC transport system permease protein
MKRPLSAVTAQTAQYTPSRLFLVVSKIIEQHRCQYMGIINRAIRNISRRKIRALLVVIALGFSMAIMISIPAGVMANQQSAKELANNLSNTITNTGQSINQTMSQIDLSLASEFSGFGFARPNSTSSYGRPGSDDGNFVVIDPSQFGGGTGAQGRFGGGAFGGGQASPMNESLYTDINRSISGIATVEPILTASEGSNETVSFMGRSFTRQLTEYTIEGIPLTSDLINNYPILNTNITAGRNLQAGDSGVVVLSENNSAYFNAGVGDTISILGHDFTIVGIHGTSSTSDRLVLYMNLSDTQAITNNTGYITSMRVFADSADIVSSVASTISSMHPELTVTTGQERLSQLQAIEATYTSALASAQSSIDSTQTTANVEIIIVVAATSLIVLFVMLFTVRERTKEIGTLKAIGFSNATVTAQFLLEGIVLSTIAGLVGIAIGIFAAPTLSSLMLSPSSVAANSAVQTAGGIARFLPSLTANATLTLPLILAGFGAAVALGAVGSLYPAWRAAKIRPAEAMRYE